jgi:hypothetical protein
MDENTWRFINTFAPWFSALGTFTSAVVALYLGLRGSRIKVRVHTSMVEILDGPPYRRPGASFLQISAVNHGVRSVTLTSVYWRLAGETRRSFFAMPLAGPYSARLPVALDHGQQASFLFPDDNRPYDPLLERLRRGRWKWWTFRRLRVGVRSSLGATFEIAPSDDVQRFLEEGVSVPERQASGTPPTS